jgi:hypothetical protein
MRKLFGVGGGSFRRDTSIKQRLEHVEAQDATARLEAAKEGSVATRVPRSVLRKLCGFVRSKTAMGWIPLAKAWCKAFRFKGYFVATIGLLLVMFPVMSGMTGLDTHTDRGLSKRIFALTVFPPIGVGAFVLARRILMEKDTKSEPGEHRSREQLERVGSVKE